MARRAQKPKKKRKATRKTRTSAKEVARKETSAKKTSSKKKTESAGRCTRSAKKAAGSARAPQKRTRRTRPRTASSKKKKTRGGKERALFVLGEGGTRFFHDLVCRFSIEPFVPLIQKLLDAWVMPAHRVEAAVARLLNPSEKTLEVDHYWTVAGELFEWGYYSEALDCLERVLQARPNDTDVLRLKVAAHENVGQADEARAWKKRLAGLRARHPTQRYLLDRFIDALVKEIDAVLARNRRAVDAPVVGIKLGFQDAGSIVPDELWLALDGAADSLDLSLSVPDTRIPWHEDQLADDSLLGDFIERHDLRADSVAWVGARVPSSLLHLELSRALPRVAQQITDLGIELSAGCTLSAGDRTSERVVADNNPSRQRAREQATQARVATQLGKLPGRDTVEALAWLCYESADRRHWLVELGTRDRHPDSEHGSAQKARKS